jgi:magnesium transporter
MGNKEPAMIELLRVINGRLAPVESNSEAEIIRLVNPDEAEIKTIQDITHAPYDFITAATDRDERPRVEIEDEFKLVIMRVPYEDRELDVPMITIAFGIVLTPDYIISVCSLASPVWDVLQKNRARIPSPSNRGEFLCSLFMGIAKLYLSELNKIRNEADDVELAIHHSMKNEILIRMLNLEKCLVYFNTSLRAHEPLWDRFRKVYGHVLSEDEQDLLDDVRIEFRQAQELAEIHSNILSSMMDAFASIISNNLNVVMKFLTAVTIILMLPTLIASIYGMNVELPFQHSLHAFWITIGISLMLSIIGVLIFLRKRFF